MKQYIFIFFALLSLLSCNNSKNDKGYSQIRQQHELEAEAYLEKARALLKNNSLEEARSAIVELRSKCPRAISAREAALITMDSIDLAEAKAHLVEATEMQTNDSISADVQTKLVEELCQKIKFYQRKLDHDRKAQSNL